MAKHAHCRVRYRFESGSDEKDILRVWPTFTMLINLVKFVQVEKECYANITQLEECLCEVEKVLGSTPSIGTVEDKRLCISKLSADGDIANKIFLKPLRTSG